MQYCKWVVTIYGSTREAEPLTLYKNWEYLCDGANQITFLLRLWIYLPGLLAWESMLTFNVATQYWDSMASQLWFLRIVYKYFLTISSTCKVDTYINFSMVKHELLVWTELLKENWDTIINYSELTSETLSTIASLQGGR